MLRILATLVALTLSAPALADTIDFSDEVLTRVASVQNGVERLRVFLNRHLVVERTSNAGTDVGVDGGDVDVVLEEHFLREVVKGGVRGKIVAIEGDYTSSFSGYCSSSLPAPKTVWVTFSPNCADKSCAFGFGRAYTQANGGYYTKQCERGFDPSGRFYLVSVPANTKYTQMKTFSKKGLMKRPMTRVEASNRVFGGVHLTNKPKYSIRLQLDLDEFRRVVSETNYYPGVD
ncbi:MAG: hypothetical protein IT285_02060 [Bdellovibrionales bacterium]|nr:hypothetical protein [Bdellovibrionales bacterium]